MGNVYPIMCMITVTFQSFKEDNFKDKYSTYARAHKEKEVPGFLPIYFRGELGTIPLGTVNGWFYFRWSDQTRATPTYYDDHSAGLVTKKQWSSWTPHQTEDMV